MRLKKIALCLTAVVMLFTSLHGVSAREKKGKALRENKKAAKEKRRSSKIEKQDEWLTKFLESENPPTPKEKPLSEVKPHFINCPICNRELFISGGPKKLSDFTYTQDKDMCHYDEKMEVFTASLILCPQCGYSSTLASFFLDITGGLSEKVQKKLSPKTRKALELPLIEEKANEKLISIYQIIPTLLKYDNAFLVAEWKERPRHEMAMFALQAAWLCRAKLREQPKLQDLAKPFSTVNTLIEKRLPEPDQRKNPEAIIKTCEKILQERFENKTLTRRESIVFWIILSGAYDRLGKSGATKRTLEFAYNLTAESAPGVLDKQNIAAELKKRATLFVEELRYLKEACNNLKTAIKRDEYSREGLPIIIYLIGELHRRLADINESYRYIETASRYLPANSQYLDWAEKQLQLQEFKSIPGNHEPKLSRYDEQILASLKRKKPKSTDNIVKEIVRDDCKSTLDVVKNAIFAFKTQYNRYPVSLQSLADMKFLKPYYLRCPATGKPYVYVRPSLEEEFPDVTPMVFDAKPHEENGKVKYYILFVSGTIKYSRNNPETE